jgi:hypothetical protein
MLRYPYLFSLPYKLIRDVLKKILGKGIISQDLLQGLLGEKRKISCWMFCGSVVQWFSGMLFCCAGSALYNTILVGFCWKQEEGSNQTPESTSSKFIFNNFTLKQFKL